MMEKKLCIEFNLDLDFEVSLLSQVPGIITVSTPAVVMSEDALIMPGSGVPRLFFAPLKLVEALSAQQPLPYFLGQSQNHAITPSLAPVTLTICAARSVRTSP